MSTDVERAVARVLMIAFHEFLAQRVSRVSHSTNHFVYIRSNPTERIEFSGILWQTKATEKFLTAHEILVCVRYSKEALIEKSKYPWEKRTWLAFCNLLSCYRIKSNNALKIVIIIFASGYSFHLSSQDFLSPARFGLYFQWRQN